jgi:hypothetical protein
MAWRSPLGVSLRRRWFAAFGIAVMAGTLSALLLARPRFGPRSYRGLRLGMTEAEVSAALGCPAGDYGPAIWRNPDWFVSTSDLSGWLLEERGRPLQELEQLRRHDLAAWVQAGKPFPGAMPSVTEKRWWGRQYGIEAAFDAQGRAVHYSLWGLAPPRPPPDIVRYVRWWLGW